MVEIMKAIFFIFLMALPSICFAEFTDEFRGRTEFLTFTNDEGEVVTEVCVTKLGIFDREADPVQVLDSIARPGADILNIPTACLAFEHWWLSFELLMKGQRHYWGCVKAVAENQTRLGIECRIDEPCWEGYDEMILRSQYWVPSLVIRNADNWIKAPRREDYITHFKAGLIGLNDMINHLNACEVGLEWIRTLK